MGKPALKTSLKTIIIIFHNPPKSTVTDIEFHHLLYDWENYSIEIGRQQVNLLICN